MTIIRFILKDNIFLDISVVEVYKIKNRYEKIEIYIYAK